MFETSDIYLAVYLDYKGFSIVGTTMRTRKVFFQFDESEELKKHRADFFESPFREYTLRIKALKDLLYTTMRTAEPKGVLNVK